jgi:transketolase
MIRTSTLHHADTELAAPAGDHRGLPLASMANALRALAMDAVETAQSGHPGMPMGMADVATVLFSRYLRFDPDAPDWPDRDRFVLSAGHGSMLQYALLHLIGVPALDVDQLKRFRQWGSLTPGHPEHGHTPGVETTTGPLGQGLANAVGMALAERMLAARFGADVVDHHTYVIAGDGCLMEGLSQEAISLAGHLQLSRLIVLYDDNGISIDGGTDLACSDDALARFVASGWSAQRVDGHDCAAVAAALDAAMASERPTLIACRTVIGYGAPNRQGSSDVHGAPLGADEVAAARQRLGWSHAPFEVPETVRAAWRAIGARGAAAHRDWRDRVRRLPPARRQQFEAALATQVPGEAGQALKTLAERFQRERPRLATRQASKQAIEALAATVPHLLGGSADLTHSNLTLASSQRPLRRGDFAGSYLHYGIREHAMGAAMNGIALHGGFIPYGGTFLAFSDYARPAIRLAALMRLRVIYVMTHDSIGLGEDGPTHQPVEHLASLRAIPRLQVFRPADAVETAEAWGCALASTQAPSVLCLSRQALPTLPRDASQTDGVARGAYVLREPPGGRQLTFVATGSEVALALEAAEALAERGVRAAVVSAPCFEVFAEQPQRYRDQVLGAAPRIGVEAAVEGDWARWLGARGRFVGLRDFGASAPAAELYRQFGLTRDALIEAARAALAEAATAGSHASGALDPPPATPVAT